MHLYPECWELEIYLIEAKGWIPLLYDHVVTFEVARSLREDMVFVLLGWKGEEICIDVKIFNNKARNETPYCFYYGVESVLV